MFISMKPQLNKDFIRTSLLKMVSQCHGMSIQRAKIPSLAIFLAHQAHYMSSSVAYALGVKIEDIMKAAI